MAEASHYEHLYDVETYCPMKQKQVKLTLGSNEQQNGEIVKGKPLFCNFEFICSKDRTKGCFLNSISIETRRRYP